MKYILIVLSVLLVSNVLLVYTTSVLPPFDDAGGIIGKNLIIVLGEFLLWASSFFTLIHLAVDKILSKEIRLNDAVRRGLLFGASLSGLAWMRVYGVLKWWLGLVWVLVLVIIEVIVIEIRN